MNPSTTEARKANDRSIRLLRHAWQGIEKAKPGIRIREAAKALGTSEAQLLATTVGEECIRLEGNWQQMVHRWKTLGEVMSLTRNDACILEHKGIFQKVNTFGEGNHIMGTVIGPIETRIFFKSWHVAFAVQQEKRGRLLQSIQVFDKAGDAITKIYLQPKSNSDAYHQLVHDFRSPDQHADQPVERLSPEECDDAVDQISFLADWDALQDTHGFSPMLRKYKVSRYHALELAAEKYTYQVKPQSVQQILEYAAASKLPVMIFAGNKGNLQIHQGKIRTIRMLEKGHTGAEKWLNVLDPKFNMHLRTDLIDTAWIVKKPTQDGIVTSVELFDQKKRLIIQLFGLRKPGTPQIKEWIQLIDKLSHK